MRIRVTKVQVVEFDAADCYYTEDAKINIIRDIETENVESEGDRYFRGRGATEITVEEVTEERRVA